MIEPVGGLLCCEVCSEGIETDQEFMLLAPWGDISTVCSTECAQFTVAEFWQDAERSGRVPTYKSVPLR